MKKKIKKIIFYLVQTIAQGSAWVAMITIPMAYMGIGDKEVLAVCISFGLFLTLIFHCILIDIMKWGEEN